MSWWPVVPSRGRPAHSARGKAARCTVGIVGASPTELASGCPSRYQLRFVDSRFKCCNASCAQRTFSESLGELATRSQRRTSRLTEALRRLGFALGGAAAGRLSAHLGIGVSGDTMLRVLHRTGCPTPKEPPVVVGIDDWAITRGHRYGTIIVDLERRQPIDVLGGRESTVVADWLDCIQRFRSSRATAREPTRRRGSVAVSRC